MCVCVYVMICGAKCTVRVMVFSALMHDGEIEQTPSVFLQSGGVYFLHFSACVSDSNSWAAMSFNKPTLQLDLQL